jgi:hypothetical protein
LNGNKGTFVEVDSQSSGCEVIKNLLQVCHMLWDGPNDDKSIIGVLKDMAREVVDQRVEEEALSRRM